MDPVKKPETNQSGAGPQDGGTAGANKKIAGKWDTLEEAVEQGYMGLERAFHAQSEELSSIKRLLEDVVAQGPVGNPGGPVATVDNGSGGRPDPYGRDAVDTADFLVNPQKYLDERDAKLEKRLVKVVGDSVSGAMAVGDFKAQNPDLAKHERIMRTFMGETDSRKSIPDRLKDAAGMAREWLATIKTDGQNAGGPAPRGDGYVEGPREGDPLRRAPAATVAEEGTEEDLVDYIKERQMDIASHFGPVEK
ncbi:hypothetical protein LCGC14_1707070 [marine sediment metagenome]|uniref:Uncharacterized protein n=1 Tax=marine sediment metagenome TaxID=412755 RepID=A0A0F9HGR8_9ZZZZ